MWTFLHGSCFSNNKLNILNIIHIILKSIYSRWCTECTAYVCVIKELHQVRTLFSGFTNSYQIRWYIWKAHNSSDLDSESKNVIYAQMGNSVGTIWLLSILSNEIKSELLHTTDLLLEWSMLNCFHDYHQWVQSGETPADVEDEICRRSAQVIITDKSIWGCCYIQSKKQEVVFGCCFSLTNLLN